jgi:hypothetical protein
MASVTQRNTTAACLDDVDANRERRETEGCAMSAKAEPTVPARHVASYVLAIVLALDIGATAGSLITQAFETDATATAANLWRA